MRHRTADFGPALSDQDSRARKCEELRCWVPGNLDAGLGTGSGQTAAAVFPSCFPVVPFRSFPVVSKP